MNTDPDDNLLTPDSIALLQWAKRNPEAAKALASCKAAVIETFWLDYLPPEEAKRLDVEASNG